MGTVCCVGQGNHAITLNHVKNIHTVHVTFLSTFLITELFIRLVFEQFMKPTKNIIISAERTRVIHIDNSNSVDTQVNSQYTYCMCIQ